jgi:tetratricopeptide (TPR) repeat protein
MPRSRFLPFAAFLAIVILLGWTAVFVLSPPSTRLWTVLVLLASVFLTVAQVRRNVRSVRRRPPALPAAPVPTGTVAVTPKYVVPFALPPATSLVGREEELLAIRLFLRQPGPLGRRVVVVHGAPGIGKTALAIAAAHQAADDFTDGALFASLGGADLDSDTAEAITEAVLGDFVYSLQGPGEPVPDGLAARRDRFRELTLRTRQRVLVVLDDAPDADAVDLLRPAGDHSAVLVTSRDALVIPDAYPICLEPLESGPAIRLLRDIVGDRVDAEDQAARIIVTRTGRSPLALQLAAASLASRQHWTLTAAVESMRLLPNPAPGDDAFSRTLDLSFALLTEEERQALLLLGLLDTHTFAPWMLAAMLDTHDRTAWRICDRLAHARLLEHVIDDATGVAEFRVLEHVRNYARNRLRFEQVDRSGPLRRLHEQQQARGERDLRMILRHHVYPELDRGQLTRALNHARDALSQARENTARALAQLDKTRSGAVPPPAGALLPPSIVGLHAADHQQAADRRAERLSQIRTDEGLALAALSEVLTELGGVDDAMEIAESALRTGSVLASPRALRCQGRLQRRQRRLRQARETLAAALDGARAIGDVAEQARIWRELAVARGSSGQIDEGLDAVAQALALDLDPEEAQRQCAGLLWARSLLLVHRADRCRDSGDAEPADAPRFLDDADRTLREAAAVADAHRQRLWRAWIGWQRARVVRRLERFELGRVVASRTMEEFAQMRHRYGVALCRLELGRSYLAQQRPLEALPVLEEARHTLATCGDRWIEAETAVALADAQQRAARFDEAVRELRLAITYYDELGEPAGLAAASDLLDQIHQPRALAQRIDSGRRTAVGFWAPQHSG